MARGPNAPVRTACALGWMMRAGSSKGAPKAPVGSSEPMTAEGERRGAEPEGSKGEPEGSKGEPLWEGVARVFSTEVEERGEGKPSAAPVRTEEGDGKRLAESCSERVQGPTQSGRGRVVECSEVFGAQRRAEWSGEEADSKDLRYWALGGCTAGPEPPVVR